MKSIVSGAYRRGVSWRAGSWHRGGNAIKQLVAYESSSELSGSMVWR